VLASVRHFHEMRSAADVPRRPKLGFSWTLKRNNIAEFPDFVRLIAPFEPDILYVRHLLLYHERERGESLLGDPALTNLHLRKAYELLAEYGIQSDCPPLMASGANARGTCAGTQQRDGCMFVWRTAVVLSGGDVPTCSAPFAEVAGHLGRSGAFWEIWNGATMQAVRSALDTDREWSQCRNCWYREGRYEVQRATASRRERFDIRQPSSFTNTSWDFTSFDP
jgi:radical SAM protein with 4Fe4S-binding SPASM domain